MIRHLPWLVLFGLAGPVIAADPPWLLTVADPALASSVNEFGDDFAQSLTGHGQGGGPGWRLTVPDETRSEWAAHVRLDNDQPITAGSWCVVGGSIRRADGVIGLASLRLRTTGFHPQPWVEFATRLVPTTRDWQRIQLVVRIPQDCGPGQLQLVVTGSGHPQVIEIAAVSLKLLDETARKPEELGIAVLAQ